MPYPFIRDDEASPVNVDDCFEAAGEAAIKELPIGKPLIGLMPALHRERWKFHPGSVDFGRRAQGETEPVDGDGVRCRRDAEIDVDAAVEFRLAGAVDQPGSVMLFERQLLSTTGACLFDNSRARPPIRIAGDPIRNMQGHIVLHRENDAVEIIPVLRAGQAHHLEAFFVQHAPPDDGAGKRVRVRLHGDDTLTGKPASVKARQTVHETLHHRARIRNEAGGLKVGRKDCQGP